VTLAVKEIISGLQVDPSSLAKEKFHPKEMAPEFKEIKKEEETEVHAAE